MTSPIVRASRRNFLQFLATSPVFASGALSSFAAEGPTAPDKLPDPIIWAPLKTEELIKNPTWPRGLTTRSRCVPIERVS